MRLHGPLHSDAASGMYGGQLTYKTGRGVSVGQLRQRRPLTVTAAQHARRLAWSLAATWYNAAARLEATYFPDQPWPGPGTDWQRYLRFALDRWDRGQIVPLAEDSYAGGGSPIPPHIPASLTGRQLIPTWPPAVSAASYAIYLYAQAAAPTQPTRDALVACELEPNLSAPRDHVRLLPGSYTIWAYYADFDFTWQGPFGPVVLTVV